MFKGEFCDNCIHLKPTEEQQSKAKEPHICTKYSKQMKHFNHPLIKRLDICMKENYKEVPLRMCERKLWTLWDYALQYCLRKGLTKEELDFYQVVPNLQDLPEEVFLSELAWCVYNAGMKETVIQSKWNDIRVAFFNFDVNGIVFYEKLIPAGLEKIFNHAGKANAVIAAAKHIQRDRPINKKLSTMTESEVLEYLQSYPFIGSVTKFHLAKNLGFDVVKPDRHLVRLAEFLKYCSPDALVSEIKALTGERKAFIDFILWRWLSWQGKEAYEVINSQEEGI